MKLMKNHLSRILFFFCLIAVTCEQNLYAQEINKNTRGIIPRSPSETIISNISVKGDSVLVSEISVENDDNPTESIDRHNNEDLFEPAQNEDDPTKSTDIYSNEDLFESVEKNGNPTESTDRHNNKGLTENPSVKSKSPSVKQEFLLEAGPPTHSYIQLGKIQSSGIQNTSSLQYFLGKDNEVWRKEEIAKGQVQSIRCEEYPYLMVETKSNNSPSKKKRAVYQIECQSRYTFVWNGSNRRWELRKIKKIK